jgi:hypothetical protein
MARRARSVVVLAVCAGALVACNLIAGLTEDYAVVPQDGAAPGTEAGADGAADGDGAKADAPISMTDGGMDSGTEAGPTVPFCETVDAGDAALVFCEDFEEAGTSPFGFDSIFSANTADASFTVDPAGGLNGKSAGLRVVTDKGAPSAAVWVEKIIAGNDPNQHAHYEAQLDFEDEASAISYTALGLLTFDDGTSPVREHGFGTFANGTVLSKLSPQSDTVLDSHSWHHAVIRLDRPSVGAPYDRYLEIDSTPITVTPAMSLITTGGVELRLGTFNTGSGTSVLRACFDNVVVREW